MTGLQTDILIVGAGFNGVYQLHKLRKAGFSVKLFEAGSGLGGVWYWNRYPLSMEELWRDWNWTEKFPGRQELVEYFKYVDEKLDLSRDISFNTRVTSASFDTTTNRWSVFTDTGVTVNPRFMVLCTGVATKPLFPVIPGLDTFQGIVHHTSSWPEDGFDMTGKRVGVIGTGASGVQVIQEAGLVVAHLTVFQRTPNTAVAMMNECPISVAMQTKMKEDIYPILFKRLNDEVYAFWRKKVLERVQDPDMELKLAPEKPRHPFGVKRVSLEQWYHEVFNQPNVDLIDINENPIVEITPKGVKTQDGMVHELDVLVLATGFDAITGSISQIGIKGVNGVAIGDMWKQSGLLTYLGMTVTGYPNMFFPYGPHGPTAFCNGPTCAAWVQRVNDIFNKGFWYQAKSYYTGANVPGKRLEALNFPGGLPLYINLIQESARGGYAGFTLT
ncbi:Cyclopentanone 1,2-monooxygenase [Termitomyces sp. J132]|nr:Cyclopentanone 1,2-monooxygenase [Termitomyces sp. J132]